MDHTTIEQLPENMASVIGKMADNGVTERLVRLFAKTSCEIAITEENQDQILAVNEVVDVVKHVEGVDKRRMFAEFSAVNKPLVDVLDTINGRPVMRQPYQPKALLHA